GLLVTLASPGVLTISVYPVPALSITTLLSVVQALTPVTIVSPESVAPGGLFPSATVTVIVPPGGNAMQLLPYWSAGDTANEDNGTPALPPDGWVPKTSWVQAAGWTKSSLLVSDAKFGAEA